MKRQIPKKLLGALLTLFLIAAYVTLVASADTSSTDPNAATPLVDTSSVMKI